MLFFLKTVLEEVYKETIDIQGWVDHKGAVQSINSTNTLVDKRLRINTAMIRQMIDKKGVAHSPGKDQLADCLTKCGADSSKLLETVNSGRIFKP